MSVQMSTHEASPDDGTAATYQVEALHQNDVGPQPPWTTSSFVAVQPPTRNAFPSYPSGKMGDETWKSKPLLYNAAILKTVHRPGSWRTTSARVLVCSLFTSTLIRFMPVRVLQESNPHRPPEHVSTSLSFPLSCEFSDCPSGIVYEYGIE